MLGKGLIVFLKKSLKLAAALKLELPEYELISTAVRVIDL